MPAPLAKGGAWVGDRLTELAPGAAALPGVGVAVVLLSLVRGKLRHRFGAGWTCLWTGGC